MAVCRKCGANPQKESVCLVRVNELGVDGIWECAPICNSGLSQEDNLLLAIDPKGENLESEYVGAA